MLEFDVNENPLQEVLAQPFPNIKNGLLILNNSPGLGVQPDLAAAKKWLVQHNYCQ